MNISKRCLLKLFALLPLPAAPSVYAQQTAGKVLRLIVPASTGTSLDTTARFMAEPLAHRLNVSAIVDNKVGANGIIGTDFVAKAPADGMTLLFTGIPSPHYTNTWLAESPLPYDANKDFAPVARVLNTALILLVPVNSPYATLADLVKAMKAKPGEVTYASAGIGSTTHMAPVVLNDMTQTQARHIPYKGAAGAVTDTAGGQVAFTFQSAPVALSLVKGGKLRALAVSGVKRLEGLPDIPTVAEAGVPGYNITSGVSVVVAAATPPQIVQKLSDELVAIASMPTFREYCITQSLSVDIADAGMLRAEIPKEVERWKRITELTRKG